MFVRSNPERRIEQERQAAKDGYRNQHSEREWYDRAPPDDVFETRKREIENQGIQVVISLWVSGSESNPDDPLIGFQVRPLNGQHMVLDRPPAYGTPWHISVGFAKNPPSPEQRAFMRRFAHPRIVRLRFSEIKWNGVATLDPERDPIASDPVVKAFHASDPWYADRPLHISL